MSKKSAHAQSRHHLMIYDEVWEWFEKNFGAGSMNSRVGVSKAINHVLYQRVMAMKAKENGELDRMRDIQAQEAKGINPGEG